MARAKQDEVELIVEPDFAKMKKIFQRDIKSASEKSDKARGDLSAAWKAVQDDCHCNKKAAKLLFWLGQQSEELQDDFLRTLYGGMVEMGLGLRADLVDKMEGEGGGDNVLGFPTAKRDGLGAENLASLN